MNKQYTYMVGLQSRDTFCDGFKINKGPYEGSLEFQRFLHDNEIQAKLP